MKMRNYSWRKDATSQEVFQQNLDVFFLHLRKQQSANISGHLATIFQGNKNFTP